MPSHSAPHWSSTPLWFQAVRVDAATSGDQLLSDEEHTPSDTLAMEGENNPATQHGSYTPVMGSNTGYAMIGHNSSHFIVDPEELYLTYSATGWNLILSESANKLMTNVSNSTSIKILQTPLAQEYKELGEALTLLAGMSDNSEWRIENSVYEAARFVASHLAIAELPVPKIFNHGSKSVVFNWTDNSGNTYLTVSAEKMSALKSTPERIQLRREYDLKSLVDAEATLFDLQASSLNPPIMRLERANSEPSDLKG